MNRRPKERKLPPVKKPPKRPAPEHKQSDKTLYAVDYTRPAKIKLNSNEWIILSLEGVASVAFKDHTISASSAKFINLNNNAFSAESLHNTYQTFIGGHFYYNHIQNADKSIGFILDAQIIDHNIDGEDIAKVQLLVAGNLDAMRNYPDKDIAQALEDKKLEFTSMGCVGETTPAPVEGSINVAELIHGEVFYEISLVDEPAYQGAALNHFLHIEPNKTVEVIVDAGLITQQRELGEDLHQAEYDNFHGFEYWKKKAGLKLLKV